MAIRCTACGYELSNASALVRLSARPVIPVAKTAGPVAALAAVVSDTLAEGCNKAGVRCPDCRESDRWEGLSLRPA